ncbi:MAG: hypothetical protein ABJA78_19570 [Ferruginibacter sp.]
MIDNNNVQIPKVTFDINGELVMDASATSSKNDFDFLNGNHTVYHKKLKSRLKNNNEWYEFEGTHSQELILNGGGNIEQQKMIDDDGKPIEGTAIRLFNPKTKLWSIYWADSKNVKLDPPVVGSFENKIAHFFTKDIFNNKKILVAFQWNARETAAPIWRQAFSDDNGQTWEWNWYMYFSKIEINKAKKTKG